MNTTLPVWAETLSERPTISVAEAGALCGLSKDAAYAAVHRGEIPALRLGRTIRVPTVRLLELLGIPPQNAEEPGP